MADLNWLLENPFDNKREWDKAFEIKKRRSRQKARTAQKCKTL